LLSGLALVRGAARASGKRMVVDKRDSYKKLEKRPADAGLFIIYGDARGTIIPFIPQLRLCR